MHPTRQKKSNPLPFLFQRKNKCAIFFLPILVICVIVFNVGFQDNFSNGILTTVDATTQQATRVPKVSPLCLLPKSYAPLGPGACVLTEDGAVHMVEGMPAPPLQPWNTSECAATLRRLAPWLNAKRRDFAAAPPLRCQVDGKVYHNTPLLIVEKHNASYNVTEPIWANLFLSKGKENNSTPLQETALECPKLYLSSHTEGYAQTFNQFQGIVNTLWLSKKINRTFVIPTFSESFFLFRGNTVDVDGTLHTPLEWYFNLTRLRQAGYCIISYSEFAKEVQQHWPDEATRRLIYYGHAWLAYARPFKSTNVTNVAPRIAPPAMGGPPLAPLPFRVTFDSMNHLMPSDDGVFLSPPPDAPLLLVESGNSLFLRTPMKDAVYIYSLIDPSSEVQKHIEKVRQSTDKSSILAFHLRYREGLCQSEQHAFYRFVPPASSLSPLSVTRSTEGKESILDECNYTSQAVLHSIQFAVEHLLPPTKRKPIGVKKESVSATDVSIFLATDNQRPQEVDALKKACTHLNYTYFNASGVDIPDMYKTPFAKKVFGVVLDYFLMVRADVFFGNRMSSISQSACMARLGQDKGCQGVPAGFLRGVFYVEGPTTA